MSQPHTFTLKALRRSIGKRVDTTSNGGTGFTTVPDGYEDADIELVVDVEKLARLLGERAMKNKTNRSSIAWGFVKAYARNRKRIPQ